jgi:hypothetical protein
MADMKRIVVSGAGIVVTALALFVGGSFVGSSSRAAPPAKSEAQPEADGRLAALALRQKRAADAARNAFDDALSRYGAGSATVEEVALWSRRTWEADPDRASPSATTAYLDRAVRLSREAEKRFLAGHAPKSDMLAAAYFKAEAEAAELAPATTPSGAPIGVDPTGYR